ncbi:hypothetical protein RESH_06294 [Rhodopirellula europaea SH398]|uniref:Uncharacterized protein n=1 Tax=Rhodopirellula europaea SH398 TaxID=1263868 RepID=M5RV97_9BACT|nr:hypothetical protein RESH_06294 [Rhodopirellula europaea SH398]
MYGETAATVQQTVCRNTAANLLRSPSINDRKYRSSISRPTCIQVISQAVPVLDASLK